MLCGTADTGTPFASADTGTGSSKNKRLGETGHSLSAKYIFHYLKFFPLYNIK
jgi:hypothetical protein